MEHMCVRCARLSLARSNVAVNRAQLGLRSLSTSTPLRAADDSEDSGVAQAGKPIRVAMNKDNESSTASRAQRPLIRRTVHDGPPGDRPVLRRTAAPGAGPILRRVAPSTQQEGQPQVLRRSTPDRSGPPQVLRRTGAPQAGSLLNRSRAPGASAAGRTGARSGGAGAQRQGPRPGQPQRDRRRRAPKLDEEEIDNDAVGKDVDDYIAKYIDPPQNPTEPLVYNPKKMTLEDLKGDWPNTPMTVSGLTESVIQKVEWLARRLPHSYQYPEQIAEHYLKGKLTRFESEEEKQLVLKIASEMSAKTKQESDEGTLHKHETPRFQIVEDPAYTSIAGKEGDKSYLADTGVKGSYGEVEKQKYSFMENAARVLVNNDSYGPAQTQKLLDRVQALIPQGRPAAQQAAKRA